MSLSRVRILAKFLAVLAAIEGLADRAHARVWVDPDWTTMLGKSELIVLVEVVKGGEFIAKVKALKTLKGDMPKEAFWVDEFNDPQTTAKAIDVGKFQKGEKYYLFLRRVSPKMRLFDEDCKNADYLDFARALQAERVFCGWTPSAGNFLSMRTKHRAIFAGPPEPVCALAMAASGSLSLIWSFLVSST